MVNLKLTKSRCNCDDLYYVLNIKNILFLVLEPISMIPNRIKGLKTISASGTRVSGSNHVFGLNVVPHVCTVH